MVKIIFPSLLAKVTNGETEVTVSASTISEVLTQLITRYGIPFQKKILDASGNPKRFFNVYVNGKNIRFLNLLETPVAETDEIAILPSVTGG